MLRPANAAEVAQCVSIANTHAAALYPISRGRNWGLGSRVPTADATVLDLSRLNQIVSHDETFGTLRLGPGATFQDVSASLRAAGSGWFLPVIGGPSDASVVANFLERGDGAGPAADRLANIVSLQVVLPSGDRIETGYERFGTTTPLASLSSEPAGPGLNGLFTQSNFGIVTEATLLLARTPKAFQLCLASVQKGGLAAFVEALRPLAIDLKDSASITLWNGHKIAARERLTEIEAEAWFCTLGLYAPSPRMAHAQRELLMDALRETGAHLTILDQTTPDFEESAGLFLGVPNDRNVASLYASKPSQHAEPLDPDRDRCGALWLCPELPLQGDRITQILAHCEQTMKDSGYRPILGMTVNRGRTVRLFISIFYDRDLEGEDIRAAQCHDTLQAFLTEEGCLPFRLGLMSMPAIKHLDAGTQAFLASLKRSLDPKGIVAPGRYC